MRARSAGWTLSGVRSARDYRDGADAGHARDICHGDARYGASCVTCGPSWPGRMQSRVV